MTASAAEGGRVGYAAVWMLGAIGSFTVMAIAGRELAGVLTPFQILFWRSIAGGLIVAAAIYWSAAGWRQVATRRIGMHAIRHVGHFVGQSLWFYAIGVITLAEVFALEFTAPIWVALAAPFILGERFTAYKAIAIAAGFVGVLIITQPGVGSFQLGHAVGLAAALGFAATALSTKLLSRTDSTLCILFWMTVAQAALALASDVAVGLVADTPIAPWPTAETAPWLLLVGVCGLSAHYCITTALSLADATLVQPVDFLRLPVIAGVGAVLYGEGVATALVVGGALILLGNAINLFGAATARRERTHA